MFVELLVFRPCWPTPNFFLLEQIVKMNTLTFAATSCETMKGIIQLQPLKSCLLWQKYTEITIRLESPDVPCCFKHPSAAMQGGLGPLQQTKIKMHCFHTVFVFF